MIKNIYQYNLIGTNLFGILNFHDWNTFWYTLLFYLYLLNILFNASKESNIKD